MATKIIISEKQLKRIVSNHLQEHSWSPSDDDKWNLLEKDLRFVDFLFGGFFGFNLILSLNH